MLKQYPTRVTTNASSIKEYFFLTAKLYHHYAMENPAKLKRLEERRRQRAMRTLKERLEELVPIVDNWKPQRRRHCKPKL